MFQESFASRGRERITISSLHSNRKQRILYFQGKARWDCTPASTMQKNVQCRLKKIKWTPLHLKLRSSSLSHLNPGSAGAIVILRHWLCIGSNFLIVICFLLFQFRTIGKDSIKKWVHSPAQRSFFATQTSINTTTSKDFTYCYIWIGFFIFSLDFSRWESCYIHSNMGFHLDCLLIFDINTHLWYYL